MLIYMRYGMGKGSDNDYEKMKSTIFNLPKSVGETIRKHRERLNIKREELSELSKISVSAISRLERDKIIEPKFETLVALMVGMNLHFAYIEDILSKSGHIGFLFPASTSNYLKYMVYLDILVKAERITIDECNKILKENGIEPIIEIE